jgi:hypothetical protein
MASSARSIRATGTRRRFLLSYLAGALVGMAIGLAVLTPAFITGTGGKWLHPDDDYNAYLVAWHYFVADAWRFPVFDIPEMGYPEGGSVLFNDALPLAALAGKAVYRTTGVVVNPFGWWILLTYLLQGAMAVRVMRALGVRSPVAAAGAACLAVCTTAFLKRMQHTALSSHFLLLWAMALYFERVREDRARLGELWLLAGVTLLVNAYLFVMVMALHAATIAALWLRGRVDRRVVRVEALGCVAVLALGLAAGYGSLLVRPASMQSTGFGHYSWNLAGLLVPPTADVIRDATGGQYEGEAWIGAGALLLLGVCVTAAWRRVIPAVRRHAAWVAAILLLAVFAASNAVYAGGTLLISCPLPEALLAAGNFFRASGRFVWPLAYSLVLLPAACAWRWWRPWIAALLVVAAAALQVHDLAPVMRRQRVVTTQALPDLIDTPTVSAWMRAHDRLFQFPSWWCGGLAGPSRRWGSEDSDRELQLQLLAAQLHLPTNSVYTSRMLKDCDAEKAWAAAPRLEPGVLYVLGPWTLSPPGPLAALAGTDRCVRLPWAVACSAAFGRQSRSRSAEP